MYIVNLKLGNRLVVITRDSLAGHLSNGTAPYPPPHARPMMLDDRQSRPLLHSQSLLPPPGLRRPVPIQPHPRPPMHAAHYDRQVSGSPLLVFGPRRSNLLFLFFRYTFVSLRLRWALPVNERTFRFYFKAMNQRIHDLFFILYPVHIIQCSFELVQNKFGLSFDLIDCYLVLNQYSLHCCGWLAFWIHVHYFTPMRCRK